MERTKGRAEGARGISMEILDSMDRRLEERDGIWTRRRPSEPCQGTGEGRKFPRLKARARSISAPRLTKE